MAKNPTPSNDDSVSYKGEQVDPALQEKVKDYMEYTSDTSEDTSPPATEAPEPLLPADKLPISITVTEHTEEPPAEEPADQAEVVDEAPEESPESVPVAAAAAASAPEVPSAPPLTGEAPPDEEVDEVIEEAEAEPEPEVGADEVTEVQDSDVEEPAVTEPAEEPEPPAEEPADQADAEGEAPTPKEPSLPEPEPATPQDELGLETVQTARAVEDIVAHEADEVLAAEDEKRGVVAPAPVAHKKKTNKKKERSSRRRKVIVVFALFIIAAVGAVAATPASRYFLLNEAGVRASTSMRVLDDKTGQPLKNVELKVGDVSAKSDAEGNVGVSGIALGPQSMTISKPGFADQTRTITFGWGSNPLGEYKLTPTGSQFTLKITDFLSGLPVVNADVSLGEANARSNDKGEAVLTVPSVDADMIEPSVTATGYRTEKLSISASERGVVELALVPARQQAFVSKRSGTFDLYKSDVDGKNETKLLSGTGLEREDALAVAPHPAKNVIAFMSTRENVRASDGTLLSVLQIINLDNGEQTRVTQSERIQIVDWIGDRLIYVKVTQGASQDSKERHKIISYDIRGGGERELASTNYFNDVLSANGAIYYSPAMFNVNGSVGLFKINPDGTDKKSLYQKEVWNLFRTSFDMVSVSIGQEWFDLTLSNDALAKAAGPPSMLKSRVYVTSPAGDKSLWIEERDGKSTLILYDQTTKKDTVLKAQSGVKTPLRWLSDQHVVYRVANGDETADYVMSVLGGEPKKITDVTNTLGVDRWYYY